VNTKDEDSLTLQFPCNKTIQEEAEARAAAAKAKREQEAAAEKQRAEAVKKAKEEAAKREAEVKAKVCGLLMGWGCWCEGRRILAVMV